MIHLNLIDFVVLYFVVLIESMIDRLRKETAIFYIDNPTQPKQPINI